MKASTHTSNGVTQILDKRVIFGAKTLKEISPMKNSLLIKKSTLLKVVGGLALGVLSVGVVVLTSAQTPAGNPTVSAGVAAMVDIKDTGGAGRMPDAYQLHQLPGIDFDNEGGWSRTTQAKQLHQLPGIDVDNEGGWGRTTQAFQFHQFPGIDVDNEGG